jgi:hypothetical protein
MNKSLFFAEIVLVVVEGYLEFIFSALLNISYPLITSTHFGEKIGVILSYFCAFMAIIVPFYFGIVLIFKKTEWFWEEGFFKKWTRPLSEGVNEQYKSALYYF